jgi:glutaminyl-peptide cyclotransferase
MMIRMLAAVAAAWTFAAGDQVRPALDAVSPARAMEYLEKQVEFGPRVPGSEGHKETLTWLTRTLEMLTDSVELMHFQTLDSYGNLLPPMTNIIARINVDEPVRYLFCAHWDTRPRADYAADTDRRAEPILGANDGASGVAVLLELANVLQQYPPDVGVDIVLFDGEDWGEEGRLQDYFLGAREYAQQRWERPPALGVLVDMVGDADLELPIERISWQNTPWLVNRVWEAAKTVGARAFVRRVGRSVLDDHVPLIEAGFPVVNIIDFEYTYWHTHRDTPDKCSAESLVEVTRVLVAIAKGY